MGYRFALSRENHEDLSAGRVLFSAPGFPAFPVRLASETFRRAMTAVSDGPLIVWDPCCGSGYLLTVLSLLHRDEIAGIIGSDVDDAALDLAKQNLDLLSESGLMQRSAELRERAAEFDKPSYTRAAEAAQRLAHQLTARGGPLPYSFARADAFDPQQLRRALDGQRPKMVITDVPYGEQTTWAGPRADQGLTGMLRSISSVLDDDVVIAIATRGRKVLLDERIPRLASFKVGTRAVTLLRPVR
ncbi:rRNA methyltransferase [Microbacterium sp. CFH 90308]|uniref:rRNA methyltransferase n=1 Tax=Microbacterium salsuginis TaxID=2722803 RepID=A0ABX1K9T8_9MICO|nr:rRNA methyltransferase [Microbacterium sp. CFH 90308]